MRTSLILALALWVTITSRAAPGDTPLSMRVFTNYADAVIRANPTNINRIITILGDRGEGGTFYYDSGSSATTNMGTIFTPSTGSGRWRRAYSGALNVKWFGARGDGSTDDTTYIQNAIDSLADGDTLYFPKSSGAYVVTSLSLTGAKSYRLLGESGVILFHKASATSSLFTTGSDTNAATICFENMTLDGNKANRTARYADTVNNASLIAFADANKKLVVKGVTFTNSIRSSVSIAGPAEIYGSSFMAMNESDGTNATYSVFAQPNSTGTYLTVRDSYFRATDTDAADLYKQAGGIFITEGSTAGNVYEKVNITGNRFYGIGQYSGGILLDPIRVYNGAKQVVVSDNFIDGFCYGGIGIQRCDDAIVERNVILNGSNTIDNDTFAIFYTPIAREGSSPFTGSRTNETHFNCIIRGNVIKNVKGHGIYTLGRHTLIEGNVIESVTASDGGTCQPITAAESDIRIVGNILRKNTKNDIYVSGAYSRVQVVNNTVIDDGASKTDVAIALIGTTDALVSGNVVSLASTTSLSAYYLSGVTNVVFTENYAKNAAAGVTVRDSSVNVTATHNQLPSCTTPIDTATNSVAFLFNNSDLPPFSFRRDTNGTFQVYLKNKAATNNVLAGATLGVEANDSSGYIGAFPSTYSDAFRADRMVLGADSEATGISIYAPFTNQTVRIYAGAGNYRFGIDYQGGFLPQENSGEVVVLDGSGHFDTTGISSTELSYLDNATNNIQTQINAARLADGDKGDITVSSSGATWTIDSGVVTPAKMSSQTASTLFGRGAGSGDGTRQEITLGAGLAMAGTVLSVSGAASGETNTISSLGSGQSLVSGKVGVDLQLYSIAGAKGINVSSPSSSVITISNVETNTTTICLSDPINAITSGADKQYWKAPYAFTIKSLKLTLGTTSSSGIVRVDVNKNGSTIFSTRISIDASEEDSTTAATAYVLGSTTVASNDKLTFDIDDAGTGAKNLQLTIYHTKD